MDFNEVKPIKPIRAPRKVIPHNFKNPHAVDPERPANIPAPPAPVPSSGPPRHVFRCKVCHENFFQAIDHGLGSWDQGWRHVAKHCDTPGEFLHTENPIAPLIPAAGKTRKIKL